MTNKEDDAIVWYVMVFFGVVNNDSALQSNQVKRTPKESINEFNIQKLNPLLVVDFRGSYEISTSSIFLELM